MLARTGPANRPDVYDLDAFPAWIRAMAIDDDKQALLWLLDRFCQLDSFLSHLGINWERLEDPDCTGLYEPEETLEAWAAACEDLPSEREQRDREPRKDRTRVAPMTHVPVTPKIRQRLAEESWPEDAKQMILVLAATVDQSFRIILELTERVTPLLENELLNLMAEPDKEAP